MNSWIDPTRQQGLPPYDASTQTAPCAIIRIGDPESKTLILTLKVRLKKSFNRSSIQPQTVGLPFKPEINDLS